MSQVILHHYQLSPYSEKIRLALGLKDLNWRSVEIPVWTPRPKLTPMTGGYRRTPILQIGAEFHCDTLLILHVIEKLGGSGALYPRGQEGLAKAFGWWIEKGTFMNAVCLTIGNMGGKIPQELVDERRPFFRVDLEPEALLPKRAMYLQRVNALSPGSPKFSPMAASSSLARTLLRPIYQHITRSGLHGRMAARK
jgi:glutathione S-transferase